MMVQSIRSAPAMIRRALFVLTVLSRLLAAPPASNPPPGLAQVGLPDAAEAHQLLVQIRQSGIAGQFYLEFDLHQLPRRGDETVLRGKLWGSHNEQGAITRVALTDSGGREHRLLLQNGEQAAVWRWIDGRVAQLDVSALFEPLVPGVELSAFDLQMPFLFWPDAKIASINRILGRPAYAFVFHPPAAFAAQYAAVATVRSYFDTQFNAPTQTELLDHEGRVTKTLALLDLKKIGTQYIPKSFEERNETSRDKTRLVVTAAALNLDLPNAFFAPAALADDARSPAIERLVRLDP
jgi:hypothetical protein